MDFGPSPSVSPTNPLVRHVHGGETIDFTPASGTDYGNGTSGGVTSGSVIVLGAMVAIALRDIAAGAQGSLAVEGSFDFPKSNPDATLTVGVKSYWDANNKVATSQDGGGNNDYLGKVEITAASTDTTVRIQMDSIANGIAHVPFNVFSGSGTITNVNQSARYQIKNAAGTVTLGAPGTSDDGTTVTLINNSTHANVLSASNLLLIGAGTVGSTATALAFAGASITLVALSAKWVVQSNVGFTIA